MRTHRESGADITIATHAVGRKQAFLRGITKVERDTGACLVAVVMRSMAVVCCRISSLQQAGSYPKRQNYSSRIQSWLWLSRSNLDSDG